jgi:uncharacterized protein YciI
MAWFLCILKPAPRLRAEEKWSAEDDAAVGRHLGRLAGLAREGRVRFAGKTDEPVATTIGLVLYRAESPEEAASLAAEDPAVLAGVMEFELRPFGLAIDSAELP